jgi:hypothetical protein
VLGLHAAENDQRRERQRQIDEPGLGEEPGDRARSCGEQERQQQAESRREPEQRARLGVAQALALDRRLGQPEILNQRDQRHA